MTATRIAWLSPYGPRSDIGAFTRAILPHFAADAPAFDCDLYVNVNGPNYDAPVPIAELPQNANIAEIMRRYDAAVFNLGNNVPNHGRIVEVLRQVPGIAVLHDFSYHHYFAYRCFAELDSRQAYARFIHDYYGSAGFNMALRSGVVTRDATLYSPWDGENVADYPLMRPLAALASALIVHSAFMERSVKKFFHGPVLRLFLPSDQKRAPGEADMERWRTVTKSKQHIQFAAFGHIGRPKCLDAVIQAIALSPALRSSAQLTIAGHPGDKEHVREIEAMVAKLGLSRQVIFEFDVTDERLLAIKRDADAFLNLRFPNTEGASGSLIEMMNAGKPVIAYRAGCYAEVPDDAAVLLDRSSGPHAVAEAMEMLLAKPDKRIAIGNAARNHVRPNDSARYVEKFKHFVAETSDTFTRRARFITPVRDATAWTAQEVTAEDTPWFELLTRARRSLRHLELDDCGHAPEIFLTWPMDDLIALVGRVLLQPAAQAGLAPLLTARAEQMGRWAFYKLITRVCLYQGLCQKAESTLAEISGFAARITDPAFWEIAVRLQPEVAVRMMYLCVFARNWMVAETEEWVRRMRHGLSGAHVLLDFLNSAEYRQGFPDAAMGEVEQWARRETALSPSSMPDVRPKQTWPLGKPLQFNGDNAITAAIFGRLWHKADAQGRWSDGRTGDLNFLLPREIVQTGGTLNLRLRVAGTRITGPRKVVAQINREEVASVILDNDKPRIWQIDIPAAMDLKEGIVLYLIADRHFSPAAVGESKDRRSLGVMLMEGTLNARSDAGPGLEPSRAAKSNGAEP